MVDEGTDVKVESCGVSDMFYIVSEIFRWNSGTKSSPVIACALPADTDNIILLPVHGGLKNVNIEHFLRRDSNISKQQLQLRQFFLLALLPLSILLTKRIPFTTYSTTLPNCC
jgi:hypothetical protein